MRELRQNSRPWEPVVTLKHWLYYLQSGELGSHLQSGGEVLDSGFLEIELASVSFQLELIRKK